MTIGAEVRQERLAVYCKLLLKDFAIEQLETACVKFAKEPDRKFFPTTGEFYGAIDGDPASKASQGFELMTSAMSQAGSYKSVRFEDPYLMCAIDSMGGWMECCRANREFRDQEYGYWSHQFREVYAQAMKERRQPRSDYFPGQFEIDNSLGHPFGHGKLPEPTVTLFALTGKPVTVPLKQIAPTATLALAWEKQLQLTDGAEQPLELEDE